MGLRSASPRCASADSPSRTPRAPAELAELQRGFLAFVTGSRETPPAQLAHAREPLGVYRHMYALRMARELAREFPATRALLGAGAFDAIARGYVAAHASRSFTLEGYGAGLPDFVRRRRARGDAAALAALERAIAQGDAAAARLVRFDYDVEHAYARFLRGAATRRARARATWLALFPRGGRTARMRVAAREVAFLRALLRGADLERAVAVACRSGLGPAAIRRALERWVGSGLLRACYRSGSASIQAAPWKPACETA